MLLLLEQIRLTNWYGKYPIIYRVSYKSGGDRRISSSNSQQYHPKNELKMDPPREVQHNPTLGQIITQ